MARTKFVPSKKRKAVEEGWQQQIQGVLLGEGKTVEDGAQQQILQVLQGNGKTTRKSQLHEGTVTDMDALNCRRRGGEESDLSLGSRKARWEKLLVNMNELGQETFGEITWLQSELKAARIAMQAERSACDIKLAAMEKELSLAEGNRDATLEVLAGVTSEAKFERDKNLALENALKALRHRKSNVDRHLVVMWENMQKLTKSEEACKIELEQAVKAKVKLEGELGSRSSFDKERLELCLETTLHLEKTLQEVEDEKEKVIKENSTLADELASIRKEKCQLVSSLEMTRRKQEEEREKTLCQICLESQKDVICFPCLHFRCCSQCLQNHRKLNNTCPSCLTDISGVLSCDIGNK